MAPLHTDQEKTEGEAIMGTGRGSRAGKGRPDDQGCGQTIRTSKKARRASVYAVLLVVLTATVLLASSAVALGQVTWTETLPAGDANLDWYTTVISADGQTMLAAGDDGRLYLSTDGGDTWAEALMADDPSDRVDRWWETTAMSADGQTMLAVVWAGRLYLSTGGGEKWDEAVMPDDPSDGVDRLWRTTAISADGKTMLAGVYGGRLYLFTDGGDTWAEALMADDPSDGVDRWWETTAMSANGKTMLAGGFSIDKGCLYLSTDGGKKWDEADTPAVGESVWWGTTAISANGKTMLAGAYEGRLYLSTDSGENWHEALMPGDPPDGVDRWWEITAVSTDGKTMLAAAWGGCLYLSIDYGASWEEAAIPAQGEDHDWVTAAMSADGKTMLAGGFSSEKGSLYLSTDGGANWAEADTPAAGQLVWWRTTAISADGKTVLAGADEGRLYLGKAPYTITATANPTTGGTVTGGGNYDRGASVTVEATPAAGYHFVRWTEDGAVVSTSATYTFAVTADRTLVARFASNPTPAPKDRWSDIPDARWATDYGITADEAATVSEGYSDGTFRPALATLRCQCAKMIVDGFRVPTTQPSLPTFTDVGVDYLFFPWIEGGYEAGIIGGYSDGTFRPDSKITREQFASMLGRILVKEELKSKGHLQGTAGTYATLEAWFASEGEALLEGFADAATIAPAHRMTTAFLVYKQILKGSVKEGLTTYLGPKDSLTRAQATTMIVRAGRLR